MLGIIVDVTVHDCLIKLLECRRQPWLFVPVHVLLTDVRFLVSFVRCRGGNEFFLYFVLHCYLHFPGKSVSFHADYNDGVAFGAKYVTSIK
jgi:hypothetical protein